ncbi:MAG: glycosyltransferase [Microthrixaceae bacterium]|nr:glycosyltransferase [Microthrixaceae bacterium]
MGKLRRFTVVGAITTVADVVVFMVLAVTVGVQPWLSDAIAVVIATAVSWVLHGIVTFPDDPSQRWYRSPGPYLSTAIVAAGLSVAVVLAISVLASPHSWVALLATKLLALAVAFLYRVSRYRGTMFVAIRAEQGAPNPRPLPSGTFRLSVVLPAFNEEDRIEASVRQVRRELHGIADSGGLEILVVDDGSHDATSQRALDAGADSVIRHEVNRGKGAAVRTGMLAANGRTIAFTDSDLSYAPGQIAGLLEEIERGWDVVVGSRQHIETRTVVRAGRLRELGGRVINLLSAYALLGRYRDTQCGLKAFRSDAAKQIFSHTHIDGFAFDIEVFALVERYRLALLEVPVSLSNSERSTVRVVQDALKLIVDLFRIRAYGRAGLYEPTRSADSVESPDDDNSAEFG